MNTIQTSKVLIRGLTAILMSGVSAIGCYAQVGVGVSGGSVSGLNGSVGFAIGQVTCPLQGGFSGQIGIVVQEPVAHFGASEKLPPDGMEAKIRVSPNPTVDDVTLEIDECPALPPYAFLYDKYGLLVQEIPVNERLTHIFMGAYSTGIYTLKVSFDNQDVKTFKIIKK